MTEKPTIETIEYSVCEECLHFIAYCDADDNEAQEEAVNREIGDKDAYFATGIAPTEDDPEGSGYDEFSHHECELCRSTLGGNRHGVTLVIQV